MSDLFFYGFLALAGAAYLVLIVLGLSRKKPPVRTRNGSVVNVDQWSPEQRKKLAKLGQSQAGGWNARKVQR